MTDVILVLNAGSSSVKFAVFAKESGSDPHLTGVIDRIGIASQLALALPDGSTTKTDATAPDHQAAFKMIATTMAKVLPAAQIVAVGHRIVHGGTAFSAPVVLTSETIVDLKALIPLAPLHQPHGVRGVEEAGRLYPDVPQVACFDTAFHASKPWIHDSFALPQEFYQQGVRRYGFHGLSCQSVLRSLAAEGYPVAERRIVIAHLGNGCSATAVKNGTSHATSMGFSTLDGLIMGTRCGSIDPGVLLYWLRQGRTGDEIEQILYHQSGLKGLSGLSNDMRDLSQSGDPSALTAIDAFVARVVEEICRLAGTMGGLDAVVFCGGIGDNAADIRARVAAGLAFLGESAPDMMMRQTREEQEIMLETRALI